ncbi:MAG: hypothetical protein KGN80_06330, partial [Acidobacteriota bacterium]|nr:hypothetical protein [Acidobacteriota bacterium]
IPFIPVKKAFKTGIKGMNGMLRMALRAATPLSPLMFSDVTPVLIGVHSRAAFDLLSTHWTTL